MEDIDLLIEGEPGDRFGWAHRPILGRAWHGLPVLGVPLPEPPITTTVTGNSGDQEADRGTHLCVRVGWVPNSAYLHAGVIPSPTDDGLGGSSNLSAHALHARQEMISMVITAAIKVPLGDAPWAKGTPGEPSGAGGLRRPRNGGLISSWA